jgi:hypothetical protein
MVDILHDDCLKAINTHYPVLMIVWRQKCGGCIAHKSIMIPALLAFRKNGHQDLVVGSCECTEWVRKEFSLFTVPQLLYLPKGSIHLSPKQQKPIALVSKSLDVSSHEKALAFLATIHTSNPNDPQASDEEIGQILRESLPPIIPLASLGPRDILALPSNAPQLQAVDATPSYSNSMIEIVRSEALFLLNEFHDVAILLYQFNCPLCEFFKPIWLAAFQEFRPSHPTIVCGMMESHVDDLFLAKYGLTVFPNFVYLKRGDLKKVPPYNLTSFPQSNKSQASKAHLLDRLRHCYEVQGQVQTNVISDIKLEAFMKHFNKYIYPVVHFVTVPKKNGQQETTTTGQARQVPRTALWKSFWDQFT